MRLGQVQYEIMQVLWSLGSATARQITEALAVNRPIAHSTVQTLLRELERKEAVSHKSADRTFVFYPLVPQLEAKETAARDLLTRLFGGSAFNLVSHLLKSEEISDDELSRIQQLIDSQKSDEIEGKKQ
jgi:BlaI family penicillinase repressor